MGQEASLPANQDLEEQARAPPSATNPTSAAASSAGTLRPGGTSRKLIGNLLNRQQAGGAADHNYEQRESARAAAAGGHLYVDGNSDDFAEHSSSYNNHNGGVLQPQQQPTSYPMDPRQQQHQYPPQQQQYYPQQQSQTDPYHHAQQLQQYSAGLALHSVPPAATPDGGNGEQHVVGVMYEKTPSTTKKGIFPSRTSGRGAALISSMRNLSLGGALRGGKHQQQQQKAAIMVNDWEKQWDEDEDESEDEEDYITSGRPQQQQQQHGMPLHQMRPGMDVGHSVMPVSAAAATSLEAQQLASPSATLSPHQQQQQPNFVSPDMMMIVADDLLSKPNLPAVEDTAAALEWDTAPTTTAAAAGLAGRQEQQQQDAAVSLKPNVQMFLPMLRVLGKGSFGKVVLVQKRVGKERGQLFAMKILRKTHLVKRRQIERTRTERKVLSVVNHPFIMKLHYAFQSPDKLYLVLDYCPGGELFFHLSRFRRFPERVARFYAAELLLAIGHLHKRGIIYRDLKPENVLLDADGHVKLGDFGLAKAGIKHPCEGAISMCGTPEYMAPEVLAQQGHGFCVDYWGLGMLVYEMMTGLPPWYTTDRAKLFRRLKSAPLDIPSYFSEQSADFVSALLERNPRRRLGVTGIRTAMEHDFFRNISWRSLYARRVEAPIRPCEGWKAPEGIKDEGGPVSSSIITGGLQQHHSRNESTVSGILSDIEKMDAQDLEAATANFDSNFTRMPVESEDDAGGHPEAGAESEPEEDELDENTFLGFSFDSKDRELVAASSAAAAAARPRTHNYQPQSPIERE